MFDSIANIPTIPTTIPKKKDIKIPYNKKDALRNIYQVKRNNIINKRKQNGR